MIEQSIRTVSDARNESDNSQVVFMLQHTLDEQNFEMNQEDVNETTEQNVLYNK